jgi:hypothetical protein
MRIPARLPRRTIRKIGATRIQCSRIELVLGGSLVRVTCDEGQDVWTEEDSQGAM